MNVNLSPTFESYIQKQLDGGMYNNASEVVREALRLKMQQDEIYDTKLQALRGKLAIGEKQANNGEFSDKSLDSFLTTVKAKRKDAEESV